MKSCYEHGPYFLMMFHVAVSFNGRITSSMPWCMYSPQNISNAQLIGRRRMIDKIRGIVVAMIIHPNCCHWGSLILAWCYDFTRLVSGRWCVLLSFRWELCQMPVSYMIVWGGIMQTLCVCRFAYVIFLCIQHVHPNDRCVTASYAVLWSCVDKQLYACAYCTLWHPYAPFGLDSRQYLTTDPDDNAKVDCMEACMSDGWMCVCVYLWINALHGTKMQWRVLYICTNFERVVSLHWSLSTMVNVEPTHSKRR